MLLLLSNNLNIEKYSFPFINMLQLLFFIFKINFRNFFLHKHLFSLLVKFILLYLFKVQVVNIK